VNSAWTIIPVTNNHAVNLTKKLSKVEKVIKTYAKTKFNGYNTLSTDQNTSFMLVPYWSMFQGLGLLCAVEERLDIGLSQRYVAEGLLVGEL
jgi:hypothetical protein